MRAPLALKLGPPSKLAAAERAVPGTTLTLTQAAQPQPTCVAVLRRIRQRANADAIENDPDDARERHEGSLPVVSEAEPAVRLCRSAIL